MARLWTDGAEMGDVEFWDYLNPYGTITARQVPVPIGGEWCYAGAWLGAAKFTGIDLSEFYLRYRLRTDNNDQAKYASMLAWRNSDTILGSFSIDTLTRFCVYVGGVEVANAGIAMENNTWYLIEIHVLIANAGGRVEVFIDGEQYINYTGDTQPGVPTTIDNLFWNTNAYTNTYLDDLALNDTTGLVDNSWCGDGIIVKMTPNGNGDSNDWTGSDGDKVNNYLHVDEFPNDGDATYVYADGVSAGTQDYYSLSDLVYTNKTVLRIWPEARARKTSADGSQVKLGILPSGGADDMSAGRNLLVNDYDRIVGNEYLTNPVTGVGWVELDLDSLQVITEIA